MIEDWNDHPRPETIERLTRWIRREFPATGFEFSAPGKFRPPIPRRHPIRASNFRDRAAIEKPNSGRAGISSKFPPDPRKGKETPRGQFRTTGANPPDEVSREVTRTVR